MEKGTERKAWEVPIGNPYLLFCPGRLPFWVETVRLETQICSGTKETREDPNILTQNQGRNGTGSQALNIIQEGERIFLFRSWPIFDKNYPWRWSVARDKHRPTVFIFCKDYLLFFVQYISSVIIVHRIDVFFLCYGRTSHKFKISFSIRS